MNNFKTTVITIITLSILLPFLHAEEKLLKDIETKQDLRRWEFKKCTPEITDTDPIMGKASLKLEPGSYVVLFENSEMLGDWSGFDALQVDFVNTTGKPQTLYVLVADKDWSDKGKRSYWNRHNSHHIIPPGRYTFSLPLTGLYRGEAGSRYNQLKNPINPAEIVRLDFGFGSRKSGTSGFLIIDNFRLAATKIHDFIKAFDFGPEEQNVQMGFTPVTWNTVYTKKRGYGLRKDANHVNRARDDTFPPGPLYRDWILMAESWEAREFKVDLPEGRYHVFTVFSDPGYWGGEAIRHTKRRIEAEGRVVWAENLRNKGNYWKPNYLFEHTEPLPGADLWELYMEQIYKPVTFPVEVKDGQLNIRWIVDSDWSCKVSCVIIYPEEHNEEGETFVNETVEKQREAFTTAAAEEDLPEPGDIELIPQALRKKKCLLFPTSHESPVFPNTIPAPGEITDQVSISACPGEWEPVTFALHPAENMGKADISLSDFTGEAGTVSKEHAQLFTVRYIARRGFGSISYRIIPEILYPFDSPDLPAGITREFVIWIQVPEDTDPGAYTAKAVISTEGGFSKTLTIHLTVYPFTLDQSDFVFGFFGTIRSGNDARFLRSLGFNSFSGGKRISLTGFSSSGKPDLDFSGMNEYNSMLKKSGFTQQGWGYGGFQISHIGYTKDEVFFGKWEKETGLSYAELLKNVFAALEHNAQTEKWLPNVYGLVDETRNEEFAKRQIAQIRAINNASAWVKTGGSYSVTFKNGRDTNNYHQSIFDALDASSLNNHDESVMEEARRKGKDIYIYNQGLTRYSFGAYQWSEFRKGVRGRHQWHLHIQHGYQFFDLDGREPDTGVLYYGEKATLPTLSLLRCAEGADDFYYFQTLHNRCLKALKNGRQAEAEHAREVLGRIESEIRLNERKKPDWLDNGELRKKAAEAIEHLDSLLNRK